MKCKVILTLSQDFGVSLSGLLSEAFVRVAWPCWEDENNEMGVYILGRFSIQGTCGYENTWGHLIVARIQGTLLCMTGKSFFT